MNKKHVNKAALTEMAAESYSKGGKKAKCPACGCNCGGKK